VELVGVEVVVVVEEAVALGESEMEMMSLDRREVPCTRPAAKMPSVENTLGEGGLASSERPGESAATAATTADAACWDWK
jgi:hypothetical protein